MRPEGGGLVQAAGIGALDALERMELDRLRRAIAHAPDGAERAARQTRAMLAAIETQRAVTAVAQDHDLILRVVAEQAVAAFPAACGAMVELIDGDLLRYVAGAGTLAEHVGKHQAVTGSVSGSA